MLASTSRQSRATRVPVSLALLLMALAVSEPVSAQVPGGCETPVSQRTSEVGCYWNAGIDLGDLPRTPLFWHSYNYPTRAAAEAAKGPRAVVVDAFGKVWLYVLAEADWRPSGGERIAVIGPLPIKPGRTYTAR